MLRISCENDDKTNEARVSTDWHTLGAVLHAGQNVAYLREFLINALRQFWDDKTVRILLK